MSNTFWLWVNVENFKGVDNIWNRPWRMKKLLESREWVATGEWYWGQLSAEAAEAHGAESWNQRLTVGVRWPDGRQQIRKVIWEQIMGRLNVMLRSCTWSFREIKSQQGVWRKRVMEPNLYFRKDCSGPEWKRPRAGRRGENEIHDID